MMRYDEELAKVIAAVLDKHPGYSTTEIIRATAEQLVKRPEWTAIGQGSRHHPWPARLEYRSPDGVKPIMSVSIDRASIRATIVDVKEAAA